MNQAKWDDLSVEDKKLISAHSGERFAHIAGYAWDVADRGADVYLKKLGVQMKPATPKMIAVMKKMWVPIQATWMKKAAAKGIDCENVLAEFKAEITKLEKTAIIKR